jgi:uncharacterized protein (DUF4415 family)
MKTKILRKKSGTDWERLSTMKDEEIDLIESPELDSSFFENATLQLPEPKKSVNIRIDNDVLEWYKHQGPGYQTRMNAVLRMYMKTKKETGNKSGTKKTQKTKLNKLKSQLS